MCAIQGIQDAVFQGASKPDKRTLTRVLELGHEHNCFNCHTLTVPAHGLGSVEQSFQVVLKPGRELTDDLLRQVCLYDNDRRCKPTTLALFSINSPIINGFV